MASKRTSILLTLITCGDTTWDAQGRIHGETDLPLSDAGRSVLVAEAKRLAADGRGGLKAAAIHHPPDEASRDTARIFAQSSTKLREVSELTDPNLGLLEGMTEQVFAERFRSRHKQWKEDPIMLSPPEGEDVAAAADRILSAVAKVIRRSRGEEVGIVLHDLGISMLRCWLADRPLSAMRSMQKGPIVEHIVLPLAMLDDMESAAHAVANAS